jgi:4-amino-4-deoxy-L-arabinose transferase-like glycosyltransferase
MAMQLSTRRWQDQLTVVLGLWLIFSPLVFGFPPEAPQALNFYLAGLAMVVLAAWDLIKTYMWAVVLNILIGIWVVVSPWVLSMSGFRDIVNNAVIIGLAVIILGMWELRSDPELHKQWAGTTG